MSANGGESIAFEAPRRLTADRGPDQWPDGSRDGRSLYFVSWRGGTTEIWKIPATGGEAVQVTRNANAEIPQTSPDGSFLYYSKGSPHPVSIWRVSVERGEGTKVLDGVLRWTDGGTILYTQIDEAGRDIMLVENFQ